MPASNGSDNLDRIWRYYDQTESRIGYRFLLHGTKHFGWYERGQSKWRFGAAMRRMENVLGATLDLPRDSRVLDAGCGVGDVARAMAGRFGLDVTGIDILDFNLAEARRRSAGAGLAELTRFVAGDYHELAFPDESFDGLYTMETFVHAADPERALAEFFRVLRPGGRLVMFEYSRTPAERLGAAAREALRTVCDLAAMPAWHRLNHGDLDVLIGKAGFDLESTTDVTDRMLPMLRAFAILGALPYFVGRLSGRTASVVNALSGVEMWRHRGAWRYSIQVAHKPS